MRFVLGIGLAWFAFLSPMSAKAQEPSAKPMPAKDEDWVGNDAKSVQVLIRYLKQDNNEVVLLTSLDSLARIGALAKPAVPTIVETLKKSQGRVRVEAARTLLDLKAETELAKQTLVDGLKSSNAEMRGISAYAIGDVTKPYPEFPSCWGPGPRRRVAYPEFGKKAVPSLLICLGDPDAKVREKAVESLGQIGPDAAEAWPKLVKRLDDQDADVRAKACSTLGNLGPLASEALPKLVEALQDRDDWVVFKAADAIFKLDGKVFVKKSLPVLLAILRDTKKPYGDRMQANYRIRDLYQLTPKPTETIAVLSPLLKDRDVIVRRAIAESLGLGAEAVPLLLEALKDDDIHVRCDAVFALGRIGPEAADAVPALIECLSSTEMGMQRKAAYALGGIGKPARSAIPVLIGLFYSERLRFDDSLGGVVSALGRIQEEPETVVPALIIALGHKESGIRECAAWGLSRFGEQARVAYPALLDLMHKSDYMVPEAAAHAIMALGPATVESATSSLIESLHHNNLEVRKGAAYNLHLLDEQGRGVPDLIRLLREDKEACFAAVDGLRTMGLKAKAAVQALIEAMKNNNLQRVVVQALEEIDPEAITLMLR